MTAIAWHIDTTYEQTKIDSLKRTLFTDPKGLRTNFKCNPFLSCSLLEDESDAITVAVQLDTNLLVLDWYKLTHKIFKVKFPIKYEEEHDDDNPFHILIKKQGSVDVNCDSDKTIKHFNYSKDFFTLSQQMDLYESFLIHGKLVSGGQFI